MFFLCTDKEVHMKKTIVLTTDFSDEAGRAFAPTLELAKKLDLSVTLLHVVPEIQAIPHGAPLAPPIGAPDLNLELEGAKGKLHKLAESFDTDVSIYHEVLSDVDLVSSIVEFAAERDAAFIALSTHGRTGLRHLILGSVAEQVLRHAKTPVVTFPPSQ